MESNDFSGKIIVPFCTSGGSGIGSSAAKLEGLTSNAQWLSGKRFSGSNSKDAVIEWVNSLGLDFEKNRMSGNGLMSKGKRKRYLNIGSRSKKKLEGSALCIDGTAAACSDSSTRRRN